MKRTIVFLSILLISALVGCSSGGGGGGSADVNPYGYSFTTLTTATTPTLTSNDIQSVALNLDKTILFVGTGAGLFTGDPNAGTMSFTQDPSASLAGRAIQCLLRDTNGDLLIGTDSGLYRRAAATGIVTAIAALAARNVLSLAQVDANTIWVGMRDDSAATQSIARSTDGGTAFTFFGTAQGITASAVVQIYADTAMVMACGTGNTGKAGLFKFSASGNSFLLQDTPMSNGVTMFNQFGTTWYVGGTDAGLYSSANSGGAWTKVIDAITPYQIVLENNSRYWIPSSKGLYLTFDFAAFSLFNTGNRLNRDDCRNFTYSTDHVWVTHPGATGALNRGLFTAQ